MITHVVPVSFDKDNYRNDSYRTELGGYYGEGGRGYRKPGSHRSETR
jgi:hypothetical protein